MSSAALQHSNLMVQSDHFQQQRGAGSGFASGDRDRSAFRHRHERRLSSGATITSRPPRLHGKHAHHGFDRRTASYLMKVDASCQRNPSAPGFIIPLGSSSRSISSSRFQVCGLFIASR
jgi:hypothetical protein